MQCVTPKRAVIVSSLMSLLAYVALQQQVQSPQASETRQLHHRGNLTHLHPDLTGLKAGAGSCKPAQHFWKTSVTYLLKVCVT